MSKDVLPFPKSPARPLTPGNVLGPDHGLIEALEDLLDAAREGEIQAVAFTSVDRHLTVDTGWQSADGFRPYLDSALLTLMTHMTRD